MSLHNLAWRIVTVVTLVVTSSAAIGQVKKPFNDPTANMDPDWQFFAPVDVEELTELSPRKRANHGWFGSYDRTNLWVTRPDVEASASRGDFGWGNRYDLGFMGDDDRGWMVSFRSMGGPNVYDRVLVERIDRQNANDTNDPANPVLPTSDRNDPQLGYRAYVVGDSLNVAGLTNFELNRTWRRTPYRYGGFLEPMIGFKYSTFNDTSLNEAYTTSTTLISTGAVAATPLVERLNSLTTSIKNRMVGGQLGARYFNHVGRWTMSGEFRSFLMGNFQDRHHSNRTLATEYTALGGTVVLNQNTQTVVTSSNTEMVFGFEARAEAAYHVTKYFQVRGGIEVMDFAQGIWRGGNPGFQEQFNQDQDVQIAGFTFGLVLNR